MNQHPYFSVIIPTYNRAELIQKTLASFAAQSFRDFEIIVIDNDSSDNTEDVVKAHNSGHISYFKKQNEEQAIARNFGAQKAKGQYINFFDSDDLAYPNHLQVAFDFIQQNTGTEIFHQNFEICDSQGKIVRKPTAIYNINKQLVNGNLLSVNGMFIRRDIALAYPFPEDRRIVGSEDYFLWLKLSSNYRILHNNITTSASIQHAKRSVLNYPKEKLIQRKELMLNGAIQDDSIKNYYKGKLSNLKATTYFYIALHLIMAGYKKTTLKYLLKGVKESPWMIFTKRFFVIMRYFIVHPA